jgi:hypothetical protein
MFRHTKFRHVAICGILASLLAAAYAEDKHNHTAPSTATNPGLEKMKSLAGTWLMTDESGQPTEQVASVIKVTAAGSAVHETLFPGQPMEMMSVYTADGSSLAMTHYCMLGNQPQLKGTLAEDGKEIKFDFVGGGNLDVKKDKHMHGAVLKLIDADHIQIEGVAWENGEPCKEMCGTMKLVRKKE